MKYAEKVNIRVYGKSLKMMTRMKHFEIWKKVEKWRKCRKMWKYVEKVKKYSISRYIF